MLYLNVGAHKPPDASTVRISNPQGFGGAPTLDAFRPAYGSPVPLPGPSLNTRQNTAQYGIYAQDQVRLGERWVLSAGVRHDWVFADTRDRIADGAERLEIDLCSLTGFTDGGACSLVACRHLCEGLADGLHYRTGQGPGRDALLAAYADADQ